MHSSALSVDYPIANRPPDLTKPHCNPANQCRPVRGTQPGGRTLDNPHLGLNGQTILVQHLTHYKLTGQSLLYQLQTGWLVSITTFIVPIADQVAKIYCTLQTRWPEYIVTGVNWVASGYCNHCRLVGWHLLQYLLSRLQTEGPAVIVTIANWMANIYCVLYGQPYPSVFARYRQTPDGLGYGKCLFPNHSRLRPKSPGVWLHPCYT